MAKKPSFSGELIHFGAARLRVTGSGNLKLYFRSLDDVKNLTLPTIPMQTTTDKEPLVLGNFTNQRACLEFKTTEINEIFVVSKITIFVKVTASGYPQ